MIFLIAVFWFGLSFSVAGPVSYYGKLKARNGAAFLDGEKTGSAVQIRGVSFGWTTADWESSRFYNARVKVVEPMAKDWKAEVVRAAYGQTDVAFTASAALVSRARVETVVDAAIENDIYAIIDWHSHSAQNEVQNSKDFFEYMANKYGSYDNVIFEIFNEPTGTAANWAAIKTYAEQIIPVIRNHSSNLILVGTPNYSQQVQNVVGNAINDNNVGYVLHFYSASHSLATWQNNINNALNSGLPIFVTEYGTTNADGGDPTKNNYNSHNATRTDEWHTFMDSKKISSVAWNINDKYEGSAFFGIQGAARQFDMQSWTDLSKMTASGQYIFNKLNEYHKTAPWVGASPIKPLALNLQNADDVSIEIFSLQGKKLGTGHSLSDLNLKNGIYILLVRQGSQTKILKIAKK